MRITLRELTLTNFKRARYSNTKFGHITNVRGANRTGKTTILDGFLWLLFGKDSTGRSDFEIKTLDENNNPYHNLDHEVAGLFEVDGEQINVRRCLKEKWVTKRGEKNQVFSGHETSYYWNDVPLKESEYQAKISAIIPENLFRLLSNTNYFNALKWQERRAVLIPLAGEISNDDVIDRLQNEEGADLDYVALISALNSKKSIDEFKREISAKKKKIKDELTLLPSRIDEANRSLPDKKDYSGIEKILVSVNADLEKIDAQLMNKTEAEKEYQNQISNKIKEVRVLTNRLQEIEQKAFNAAKDKFREREQVILDKKRELRSKSDQKDRLATDYVVDDKRKNALEVEKKALVTKWEAINTEAIKFNDADFCCPTCKRAYETGDVETKKLELEQNFNADKSKRLAEVTARGTTISNELKVIEAKLGNVRAEGDGMKSEIALLQSAIAELETEHERLSANETERVRDDLDNDTEAVGIKEMIALRTEEINTPYAAEDKSDLVQLKAQLRKEIDGYRTELAGKGQREKILARVSELKDQEAKMAQEIADLDHIEFAIEKFIKAKMDTVESRINSKFKVVQFKMFEDQINGGQVEACTTLIEGVPYLDANTASKVQAGLDIINTLSSHYGYSTPVFIDNRESVTDIPDSESQIINLIVSPEHEKLTVESLMGHFDKAAVA